MIDDVRDPFDVHVGRILVLADTFSEPGAGPYLGGLTKISRLDFLLRYPVYLERVLTARGRSLPFPLWPTSSERRAVESIMARHRYGPFDERYYSVVGRLVALDLCRQDSDAPNLSLRVTDRGREASVELVGPLWGLTRGRAGVLAGSLNLSGKKLGQLIDDQLPQAQTRPWAVLAAR